MSRKGLLNFHERSLIKSLIMFDEDPKFDAVLRELKDEDFARMKMYYYSSAASHYKSFSSGVEGYTINTKMIIMPRNS